MKILTISPIDGRKNLVEFVGGSGFSWKRIITGEQVTIPTNQQMLLKGDITIEGDLIVDGELWLL